MFLCQPEKSNIAESSKYLQHYIEQGKIAGRGIYQPFECFGENELG